MKRSSLNLLFAIVMTASLACTGSDSGTDAGPDAGTDAGPDAGTDAGPDAGPDAATDAGMTEWRIFRTDTNQDANLGGIAGADAICATQALEAGLEGEFKAWLSTIASPVADRVTQASGPYVLVDGTRVADDWDDLVDGTILAPINLDANGVLRSGEVWTGTLASGFSYPSSDCAAFTNGSTGVALCGASNSTTSTWTENITPACSTPLGLYCIEQ
jgi:hypothetical protein